MDQKLSVVPLAPALGAEVFGVDLAQPLEESTRALLWRAFVQYLVLFFRDQHLSPAAQRAFAENFGRPERAEGFVPMDGYPEVVPLIKEKHETKNHGSRWHSDRSATPTPPIATMLYAIDVPPVGGDTWFANQYLAYEALSPGLRTALDTMSAVHRVELPRATRERIERRFGEHADLVFDKFSMVHPVIRVHEESGKRALYVNVFVARFDGWTCAESASLLSYLCEHAVRTEFTCRFHWEPGSVALWDNRAVLHRAANDYHGFRREMRRIVIGRREVGDADSWTS